MLGLKKHFKLIPSFLELNRNKNSIELAQDQMLDDMKKTLNDNGSMISTEKHKGKTNKKYPGQFTLLRLVLFLAFCVVRCTDPLNMPFNSLYLESVGSQVWE